MSIVDKQRPTGKKSADRIVPEQLSMQCRQTPSMSLPPQNPGPPARVRPSRDLPCVAVLSAFLNFLFAFALIAVMCALRQRSGEITASALIMTGLDVDAATGVSHPLAMFRLALNMLQRHASYANLAITGELSCRGFPGKTGRERADIIGGTRSLRWARSRRSERVP